VNQTSHPYPEYNGFSIREYHDTADIYRRFDELLGQPPRALKREAMDRYLLYFENRCKHSRAMIDRAMDFIPGGVQHNLAFNHPFPLVFTRAKGAYLEDLDGNTYIDFLQAGGCTVLGSNPEAVRKQVIELLETCGPVTGLFHEYELKISEKVAQLIPGIEMLRLFGSGTEADMAAIRVARLATGNKYIIKMGGAYHGWSDQLAYGIRIPGTKNLEAHGVTENCFEFTQEFFPNNAEELEKLLKQNTDNGGTAAVLMEPMGPESGTRPLYKGFNRQVRDLCDKYGALLVFDEVVTAFRIGLSGAQGYFGVTPDLTVLGKVLAGGYPSAGGLGGKKEYMRYLAAGIAGGGAQKALVGGTLAANPLSAAAGYFTLCEMEKTFAVEKAGMAGDRLTEGLQALIKKHGLPFVAFNQGAICHLETVGTMLLSIDWDNPDTLLTVIEEAKKRKQIMEEMGAAYMAEGIVTLAGSRLYTSAADTDDVIDEALARFDSVFQNIEGV